MPLSQSTSTARSRSALAITLTDDRAMAAGAHDAHQVALEQGDARAFHGHVSTRAHGNADFGSGQCGGIVHAVAGHGDPSAFAAQALHDAGLVLRKNLGHHFVNAQLPAHRLRCGLPIAGEHDDAHTGRAQPLQCGRGGGLDRVGNRHKARQPTVQRYKDHGRGLGALHLGCCLHWRHVNAMLSQKLGRARHHGHPIHLAQHTLAHG